MNFRCFPAIYYCNVKHLGIYCNQQDGPEEFSYGEFVFNQHHDNGNLGSIAYEKPTLMGLQKQLTGYPL
ncbi:hypothetical protein V518_2125 [Thermoanaerobacterium aotearoense SCUT27]|uniref:Uncharacterized protein n=2 Tax=Thermoanaerobacterium TaxID=28895 RepID=W9EA05_9THEO|nr:hypothetical protein Tsac_2502 [Thermoanaerobacterium saccharolyticum JW/SL-YS485]ETO37750.1 hypothetical protein V518_2125 [Thermoanaerobacterium aotearoense SCUT27]